MYVALQESGSKDIPYGNSKPGSQEGRAGFAADTCKADVFGKDYLPLKAYILSAWLGVRLGSSLAYEAMRGLTRRYHSVTTPTISSPNPDRPYAYSSQ